MGFFRLILALSVILSHFGPVFGFDLVKGKIAVQAFFIISGFYMTMILNEKYINTNNSYKLFITNRLYRLFPIYWIVLLIFLSISILYGLFINWENAPKFDSFIEVTPSFYSFIYLVISNIFIIGQDILLFLSIDSSTGSIFYSTNPELFIQKPENYLFIPQAWSISIEIMFYLLAPLFLRKNNLTIFSFIFLSFGLRFFLFNVYDLQNDPWSYRFFPSELMFFLLGYFSYKIYLKKIKWNPKIILLVILFYTVIYYKIPQIGFKYLPFTINEIVYFCLTVIGIPILFEKFKNNSFDNKIGELSYPIYISHALIGGIISKLIVDTNFRILVIISCTILFSFILNKYISYPIEKFRQSRLNSNN